MVLPKPRATTNCQPEREPSDNLSLFTKIKPTDVSSVGFFPSPFPQPVYGTVSVTGWLFVSVPDVADTVIV
jgi:hypothetical protein